VSQKPTEPHADPQAAQPTPSPEAEPTIIKDRRFWGKKAKPSDKPEAPSPADAPYDETQPDVIIDEVAHAHSQAISALTQQLADKDIRIAATRAQYKEALEEFEGAKARLKRDVAKDVEAGKKAILTGLLEVIDNLERALGAANAAAQPPSDDAKALHDGVTMVRDQFMSKLKALGVSRIEALGQTFDPTHFEAISIVPVTDEGQHDKVLGVVRDGYLLGHETLRHGMVAVGKMNA
jgi:molecular chaperone GrpE